MGRFSLLIAAMLWSGSAHAEDAASILKNMDEAMNRAEDQVIEWKVVNQEPGKKDPKIMQFTSTVSGPKALTSFSAPADLKGTRVLVLTRTQMYIYLPQYGKVRRIASHMTKAGFMGTTFSNDDMSTSRFGDVYSGKVLSEADGKAEMEFTPLPDVEAPYSRALVTVDTKMYHPLKIQYFNEKDVHIKTETRSDYTCQDNVCLASVMRMEDLTRDGAWTELQRLDWKLNTGVDEDAFTTRSLQRGE